MSQPRPGVLKSWVEREFALDGVLAAGGGRADGAVFSAVATGELVLAHDDDVWRAIAETMVRVYTGGVPAGELLWGFEHAVLCTVHREDGTWLGIFTVPKLSDESALALRAKLDAFKQESFSS
jgi:hypothetical protein